MLIDEKAVVSAWRKMGWDEQNPQAYDKQLQFIEAYEAAKAQQPVDCTIDGNTPCPRCGCQCMTLEECHKQQSADQPDELSYQDTLVRVANAIEHFMRNGLASDGISPVDHSGYFMPSWFFKAAKVAIAAMPEREMVAVDDIDAEIAIAEAILLVPRAYAYEEKGVPVLKYLKKLGYRVMRIQREDQPTEPGVEK